MGKRVRYVIKDREQSPQAEAFRSLCASIQSAEVRGEKVKSVLFASAGEGEGGTMTAVNAAAALAYAGNNVVLVDCDLRSPIVCEGFGLENVGLTNLVAGEVLMKDILQESWVANLKIVASGPLPVGPITALSNEKTRALFDYLRLIADYIVLTSSPVLFKRDYVVSDACVLASRVDSVVLVIDSKAVKPKTAQKVVDLLQGAKANIIGTVLNDVVGYE
jgi:capsular exopolysaccharide synthesis family protein